MKCTECTLIDDNAVHEDLGKPGIIVLDEVIGNQKSIWVNGKYSFDVKG